MTDSSSVQEQELCQATKDEKIFEKFLDEGDLIALIIDFTSALPNCFPTAWAKIAGVACQLDKNIKEIETKLNQQIQFRSAKLADERTIGKLEKQLEKLRNFKKLHANSSIQMDRLQRLGHTIEEHLLSKRYMDKRKALEACSDLVEKCHSKRMKLT